MITAARSTGGGWQSALVVLAVLPSVLPETKPLGVDQTISRCWALYAKGDPQFRRLAKWYLTSQGATVSAGWRLYHLGNTSSTDLPSHVVRMQECESILGLLRVLHAGYKNVENASLGHLTWLVHQGIKAAINEHLASSTPSAALQRIIGWILLTNEWKILYAWHQPAPCTSVWFGYASDLLECQCSKLISEYGDETQRRALADLYEEIYSRPLVKCNKDRWKCRCWRVQQMYPDTSSQLENQDFSGLLRMFVMAERTLTFPWAKNPQMIQDVWDAFKMGVASLTDPLVNAADPVCDDDLTGLLEAVRSVRFAEETLEPHLSVIERELKSDGVQLAISAHRILAADKNLPRRDITPDVRAQLTTGVDHSTVLPDRVPDVLSLMNAIENVLPFDSQLRSNLRALRALLKKPKWPAHGNRFTETWKKNLVKKSPASFKAFFRRLKMRDSDYDELEKLDLEAEHLREEFMQALEAVVK